MGIGPFYWQTIHFAYGSDFHSLFRLYTHTYMHKVSVHGVGRF